MEMQFITMPTEDEYLIGHTAHVRQHANQHRRDVLLHLRHEVPVTFCDMQVQLIHNEAGSSPATR